MECSQSPPLIALTSPPLGCIATLMLLISL